MPTNLKRVDKTVKTLKNGATGAMFWKPVAGGGRTKVFRIMSSSRDIAATARAARRDSSAKITQKEAQSAFDKFYSGRGLRVKRGPNKGKPRFASVRSAQGARKYDREHRGSPVVDDARYLTAPNRYDFRGVDVGPKRKRSATPAQLEALAAGRAKLAKKRSTVKKAAAIKKGAVLRKAIVSKGGKVDKTKMAAAVKKGRKIAAKRAQVGGYWW
jgi:hypothetical protein